MKPSDPFNSIHGTMLEGLATGVFPGAVLLVSCGNDILFHRSYGLRNLFSRHATTVDTVFDLASLTKPLATTLAIMRLVGQERLHLDTTCGELLPELADTDKSGVSVQHLLGHRSGLPAWRPYFRRLMRYEATQRHTHLRQMIAREPLTGLPGKTIQYSDIGFMVLQWMVECSTQIPLARFVADAVYRPLQYRHLYFATEERLSGHLPVAATELCPWRGRLLIGEVHDDNAYALGGSGGHAGLFGTAEGVYHVLRDLLAADRQEQPHPLFDSDLIHSFWQRSSGGTWALGFDTPSERHSSAGSYFAKDSVGHLGFTGASFWVERKRDIIVVLLTNRVHPSRHNTAIRAFRPVLHDCVVSTLKRVC